MPSYMKSRDWIATLAILAARLSLFSIFFWFGALKIFSESPANPLVQALLARTLPFVTFDAFIVFLGWSEMLLGVAFLVSWLDRITIPLFFVHMFTTTMPLILLPAMTWERFLVPTLEGQYIIKNIALVALVLTLIAHRYRVPETRTMLHSS
jgi:uncharacterized membrane protein YkgB